MAHPTHTTINHEIYLNVSTPCFISCLDAENLAFGSRMLEDFLPFPSDNLINKTNVSGYTFELCKKIMASSLVRCFVWWTPYNVIFPPTAMQCSALDPCIAAVAALMLSTPVNHSTDSISAVQPHFREVIRIFNGSFKHFLKPTVVWIEMRSSS